MMDIDPVDDNIKDYRDDRPPSEQLVELHVYLVPKEKWLEKRKLAKNQSVDHTISVGFVRVLPQTYLTELRKEMNKQLGVESVPQHYVFLRSVGRNFTQVRPRQEVEMKVKNFMPPYAADPEIYLKEGPYTGPNTWSQGEDSGLEESLADSNSQRSHDRATPESLIDEQLVLLPKVVDLLELRHHSPPEFHDRPRSKTPVEMAIPMAEEEDEAVTDKFGIPDIDAIMVNNAIVHHHKTPSSMTSNLSRSTRDLTDRHHNHHQPFMLYDGSPKKSIYVNVDGNARVRGGSLNRRHGRETSKERGGSQMPTWAETRTTRLRRSRALGENKPCTNPRHLPLRNARSSKSTINNGNSAQKSVQNSNKKSSKSKESPTSTSNITIKNATSDDTATPPENDTIPINVDDVPTVEHYDDIDIQKDNNEIVNDVSLLTVEDHTIGDDEDTDEDVEDNGKILMERIRANSRSLRARYSSQSKRRVTGSGSRSTKTRNDEDSSTLGSKLNSKYKSGYNGVYTMHARRHLKVDHENMEDTLEIDKPQINLLDKEGNELKLDQPIDVKNEDLDSCPLDNPEVLHLHTLHIEGEDARQQKAEAPFDAIHDEGQYEEGAEHENLEGNNTTSRGPSTPSASPRKVPKVQQEPQVTVNTEKGAGTSSDQDKEMEPVPKTVSDLHEGQHVVNRNGNLTIEVEVKELNPDGTEAVSPRSPKKDPARAQQQPQPPSKPDEFDSYSVYSEQQLPYSTSVEFQVPTSGTSKKFTKSRTARSRNFVSKQQYSRGIYLRKMEHRERMDYNIRRARSDGNGLDTIGNGSTLGSTPLGSGTTQTRRGGMGSLEKWNTTSSTGDLRNLPWDSISEKERLLVMLENLRTETRCKEKAREELLRQIKQLQGLVYDRHEQGEDNQSMNQQTRCLRSLPNFAHRADSAAVREMWRKRYFEAKKVTPRLEEECSKLRQELDKLHRELLAKVQAGVWALLTISGKTEKPSNKLSYKIMIARLLQEIEDLSRRVEGTRLKLHTELKLRSMAEKDVRNLREELLKKKIQVTLTRNQEQAAMGNNNISKQYFISAV